MESKKAQRRLYKFLYAIAMPFFRGFYPTKYIGKENIPEGGALICGNHCAANDPIFIIFGLGWNRQIHPMAKESLMKIPVIGWILKSVGTFGVKRGAADLHALKFALDELKNGQYVLVFPEGTRVKSREEGEPKTGAALMATRTGAPVLPVYVPLKKRPFRLNRIYFGEPFYMKPAGKRATMEELETFTEDLMDRIYSCGDGK